MMTSGLHVIYIYIYDIREMIILVLNFQNFVPVSLLAFGTFQ
jgi:hypothetical protein